MVELYCIKVGSKLRVRVNTIGYLRNANCQFPRDLRLDGRRYEVLENDIHLISTKGKYFYSVKNKSGIKIIVEKPSQIYTDDNVEDCIICMEEPKSTIFAPCGHFYSCQDCSKRIKQCPICRSHITSMIHKSEFGTDE